MGGECRCAVCLFPARLIIQWWVIHVFLLWLNIGPNIVTHIIHILLLIAYSPFEEGALYVWMNSVSMGQYEVCMGISAWLTATTPFGVISSFRSLSYRGG